MQRLNCIIQHLHYSSVVTYFVSQNEAIILSATRRARLVLADQRARLLSP